MPNEKNPVPHGGDDLDAFDTREQCRNMGVTPEEFRDAVSAVGCHLEKVRHFLVDRGRQP